MTYPTSPSDLHAALVEAVEGSDPRPGAPGGGGEEVECYRRAREAAGFLLGLLEHFQEMVDERLD